MGWDGFVSAAIGDLTVDGSPDHIARKSIRGSAASMLMPGFGVQFDVLGDTASGGLGGGGLGSLNLAIHGYMRNANRLFGAFGQYRTLTTGTGSATLLFGGVEGQVWVGPTFLISAQAAAETANAGATSLSGWIANGQGSWFVTPNVKLDVLAGFETINQGGTRIDTTTLGIGGEVKLNNPLSLFAKYEHLTVGGGTTTGSLNVVWGGIKWNIGAQTLAQRGMSGASLDPVTGILAFVH
jgi:hypothetical protein